MISNLGNIFQILAMLASLGAVVFSLPLCFKGGLRGILNSVAEEKIPRLRVYPSAAPFKAKGALPGNNLPKTLFYLSCFLTALAFLLLVYGFIISDFSLQNVFFNSSTIKPLIYKISGSWASHEGSMLLWLAILQIVSFSYIYLSSPYNNVQISILSAVQLLFGSFIYFTSNPFTSLSFTPIEGLGLNPMLQDIALAIHPPMLYLGNACYVVPFTAACAILINPVCQFEALKLARVFSKLAMFTLSLGVGLGSWWAYRELGWGGFWFFDPVENISIMPWLSGIALYHSLLITEKSGRLIGWTLSLSIITFLLAIFGTFLVRSGMLVSIHAFASSPERAIYILTIFAIIALSSLSLLAAYSSKFSSDKLKTKDMAIVAGNICWLLGLAVLLGATIYPIIYSLIFDNPISISDNYFYKCFIPVILPTLLLAGIFTSKNLAKTYKGMLFASIIIACLIAEFIIPLSIISAAAIAGSVFLCFQTIYLIFNKTNNFKNHLSSGAASMITGHLGFGLLVLSITLNSLFQKEAEFIGKIGGETNFAEFKITLHDIKFSTGPNYYRQIAEFWLEDKKGNITILKPENRFYQIEKALSQESDIFSYLTYDLYAVLSKIDDDIVHAKIYYRPFISFVWLSVIIMSSGFLISLLKRK